MFERYSEIARRSVFFARYEASMSGSPHIETEHMLLGLLREDKTLRDSSRVAFADAVGKPVEARSPRRERTSTSVNLPLSRDCKKAREERPNTRSNSTSPQPPPSP